MIDESAIRLDDVSHWLPSGSCAGVHMLRLDLLHPVVSGNKWFKLKYNAAAAQAAGKKTLLTFGGGYSNHLVATAFAAQAWGLRSIGMVRGDYTGVGLTPTLQACVDYGMHLHPLTKRAYSTTSLAATATAYPDAHLIPEGGANDDGLRGAAEIARHIPPETTDVCVALGTGTTFKGLAAALPQHVRLHGFYVARDLERTAAWAADAGAPGGRQLFIHAVADPRFGKWTGALVRFITEFHAATGVPLDVVYTAKMMMAVRALLLARDTFGASGRIVCLHTGGLQGNPQGLIQAPSPSPSTLRDSPTGHAAATGGIHFE